MQLIQIYHRQATDEFVCLWIIKTTKVKILRSTAKLRGDGIIQPGSSQLSLVLSRRLPIFSNSLTANCEEYSHFKIVGFVVIQVEDEVQDDASFPETFNFHLIHSSNCL